MPADSGSAGTAQHEANVRHLRELHATADGDERSRAALLLGWAISGLTGRLTHDDPRLPGLAREGLLRLDEWAAHDAPPATVAAVERSRELLRKHLPRPPAPGTARPAPAGAESGGPVWVPEGLRFDGRTIDAQQMRHATEFARMTLPTLPEGHPMRPRLQAILATADATEVLSSGRWKPEHDQTLATLRQIRCSAAELDPVTAVLIPVQEAILRGLRWWAMDQSLRRQDRPGRAELDEVIAELESALDRVKGAGPPLDGLAGSVEFMAGLLLARRAGDEVGDGDGYGTAPVADSTAALLARARDHLAAAPPEFADQVQATLTTIDALEQGPRADKPAGQDADRLAGVHQEWFDTAGGDILRATALAKQARQTLAPADIAAAISALRAASRGLPAGHPARSDLLAILASLLGTRASLTQSADDSAEAIGAAIEAVRAASRPSLETAGHLVGALTLATMLDQRAAPFEPAEAVLTDALAAADAGDSWLRLSLTIGIGIARTGRWRSLRDEDLRRLARQALDEAERMLPEPAPTDQWFAPAWVLFLTNVGEAVLVADPDAGGAAVRLADRLEPLLVEHPELAERLASMTVPGGYAALNLGSGGQGMLQALRMMRRILPVLSAVGPLSAMSSGQDGIWTQVSTTLGRLQHGRLGEPIDMPSMMQAVMAELRNDPAAFRTAMSAAMGVPVAPPPPPAEETRRLAHRGLDRAAHVLGTGRRTASDRRPLAMTDPPDPAALRAASTDLRAALASGLDDGSLRHRVHGTLGTCLAELHWLGEADPLAVQDDTDGRASGAVPTLTDAIEHLDRSLAGSDHALPTVGRADLLDVLARCYRESARLRLREDAWHDAERTVRAALRELARCVLLADSTEEALDVAARANEIVARAVGWCLTDDRPRAAVEVAEAGRSLVLASVVLAGRMEELLRGEGQDAVADAWRRGDTPGRLAGLSALSASLDGQFLLTTPSVDMVSHTLLATAMDAVVYLVPPVPSDGPARSDAPSPAAPLDPPGHALLVRPGFHVEVLELPGVATTGTGTPVAGYLAAFGAALDNHDPTRWQADGFRGSPAGEGWAFALDDLGAWTYTHIVGPLVSHTRSWPQDRQPHLTLVPLGDLAAIPFAAAWTDDPAVPGGRRYAMHDLVLSYTVSARLLADVARRSRLPLTERVVLVTDPTGQFPYARATALALARQLYPRAEVYGRGRAAPNGPASTGVLLAALPGQDRPGASLLHLSTHATTAPTGRLQTADGWLHVTRILEQAGGRPPDAAGGLVLTNACLTDSTRMHFDESVTLATALLAAGATAVVGTRWPIDDDTAATLTHHLHHHLAQGHLPAYALRLAQLDLLDSESSASPGLHPHLAALPHSRLAHPASWAGYVHHGT
jgi:hypothetical protein